MPLVAVLGFGLVFKMRFQNKFLALSQDYLIAVICIYYSAAAFCMSWNSVSWDWGWHTGDSCSIQEERRLEAWMTAMAEKKENVSARLGSIPDGG